MSWSVYKTGSRDKVRAACEAEFDRCAKSYAGQEEEKDVLAVKDRVLSAIDTLDLSPTPHDAPGTTYAVAVEAAGSRHNASYASGKWDVKKIALLV